jgi:hypothetical protein
MSRRAGIVSLLRFNVVNCLQAYTLHKTDFPYVKLSLYNYITKTIVFSWNGPETYPGINEIYSVFLLSVSCELPLHTQRYTFLRRVLTLVVLHIRTL